MISSLQTISSFACSANSLSHFLEAQPAGAHQVLDMTLRKDCLKRWNSDSFIVASTPAFRTSNPAKLMTGFLPAVIFSGQIEQDGLMVQYHFLHGFPSGIIR
jgi:hypothetical protein